MKTVTFTIEVTCKIKDDVDPDEVTFCIDPGQIVPVVGLDTVGNTIAYRTLEHWND